MIKKKSLKKKTPEKHPKTQYESKDWEYPGDASKTGKQWPKPTRKKYIKDLFSRGILDPSKKSLAEMMGVNPKTLYEDFQDVYAAGIDLKEAKIAETILGSAMKNAVIEASSLSVELKGKDKILALRAVGEIGEKYTNFLEKFDIKKPGEIDQSDNKIEISWLPMEEAKKKKTKKPDKP